MNASIYERYSKQLREKEQLQEFLPLVGAAVKGIGSLAKGAFNMLTTNPQQQQAGQPTHQAAFAQQSIDQILVQDVDNILQKAQGNNSEYAKSVLAALNQLEDDAGKETKEKQQQQQQLKLKRS
jgi:hypothetical protein